MSELQRIIDGPWITPDDRLHLQKVQAELTRLRGIEKAVLNGLSHDTAIEQWRDIVWLASSFTVRFIANAIADALEAK